MGEDDGRSSSTVNHKEGGDLQRKFVTVSHNAGVYSDGEIILKVGVQSREHVSVDKLNDAVGEKLEIFLQRAFKAKLGYKSSTFICQVKLCGKTTADKKI